ncbi:sugar isomerase [Actinocorallia sp. API 0066]|uniref:SIS domain-containing protein n=1 Tax=Actinocorallia sp. API 0066 TaxID=2896846 RepID=UPI001E28B6E1|nr:sugar isomerase [Actinocorallia sp. API 0066]MCD0448029.1 sugar isomerase [Actinocorallia sp. API 0066]
MDASGIGGTHLAREIATQPGDWLDAAAKAGEHAALLPRPGERVAVVGCGTSFYMAQSYAALREGAGQGLTDAWAASEHRLERGYDRIIALTRSGTTTEVLRVLERYGSLATVITADGATPAVELADAIVMADVDERSVVQTRFATTALALLRASLGEDLTRASRDAQAVLDEGDAGLGPALHADQVTFVGRGWTVGLAEEAALKLRESAQAWSESYPAMEYRHGPISVTTEGRVTWAFGDVPAGLPAQVHATGGHFEHAQGRDPMADLVRVHLLCLARAAAAGLNPDEPRGLTRSVVLDAAQVP